MTLEEAKDLFEYSNGVLLWKKVDHKRNKRAGTINHSGYLCVGYKGIRYRAHRIIWLLHYGKWPEYQIDHINGNRTDNRIENLREVTNYENNQNKRRHSKYGSGIEKISKKRFRVRILTANGYIFVGSYLNLEEAQQAKEDYINTHGESLGLIKGA